MLLLCLIRSQGIAQACCSGGTPLSGSLDIVGLVAGSANVRLSYDFNFQNALVSGSNKLDDSRRSRTTHSALIRGGYAITDRVAGLALFSIVRQEERNLNDNTGEEFFTKASGIGDMILALQYSVLNKSKTSLAVAGGVKLPVGATGRINPETGIELNPDMQPGTGAWDGLFILKFDRLGLFKTSFGFTSNATFRLTTPAKRFNNQQKYEFGDELQLNAGFFDTRAIKGLLLSPHLLLKYRFTAKDLTNDVPTPNTGGHWLSIVPGYTLSFSPNWGTSFRAEIPLYRNLTGTQLTTSTKLNVSLFYNISPKIVDEEENRPYIGI